MRLDALRDKIEETGVTITFLAGKCGFVRETLHNRLAGKGEFKASEIHALTAALHLSVEERDSIFFANDDECNS